MTDIDFDELDRAVSSIMGTKTPVDSTQAKESPSDKLADETVVDTPEVKAGEPEAPELQQTATPLELTPVDESPVEEEVPKATSPAPAIVAKKRGQFMDVMHPSADMRTRPDPASVSRRKVDLKPSLDFEKKFTEEAESQAQEASVDPVVRTNDWPDSVDLVPSDATEASSPDTAEPEIMTPLTSPFLPDAKPEKRPLGGAAMIDEAPVIDDIDEPIEVPVESVPAVTTDLTENITPMPDELGADIMNVESGNMPPASTAVPSPVQPIKESGEAAQPSGPSSIPQQYHTSEPSADVEHGALYDTAAGQDVLHPAKKRSGWLVPLIIFALLILGGAAGYFVYTTHIFG